MQEAEITHTDSANYTIRLVGGKGAQISGRSKGDTTKVEIND